MFVEEKKKKKKRNNVQNNRAKNSAVTETFCLNFKFNPQIMGIVSVRIKKSIKRFRHAVPAIKRHRVDAGGVGNRLVPVGGDGVAFENGGQQVGDEVEHHEAFGQVECRAEGFGDAEDAVVEQHERGFEEERGEEVEDLEGHEDLFVHLSLRSLLSFFVMWIWIWHIRGGVYPTMRNVKNGHTLKKSSICGPVTGPPASIVWRPNPLWLI